MNTYKFKKDYSFQLDPRTTIHAKAGESHPVPNDFIMAFNEVGVIDAMAPPPAPPVQDGKAPVLDKSIKAAPKNKAN